MGFVHILHENAAWVAPIKTALDKFNVPHREWLLTEGAYNIDDVPPEGIFFSKMSASAHTRGHRYAGNYDAALLQWLESHGRVVINGLSALQLELSKAAQYAALHTSGIAFPRTRVVANKAEIAAAAEVIGYPVIVKHNQSGKGLGVRLFHAASALNDYVNSNEFDEPIDGITLVQQYIRSPEPFITRLEYIGGKFLYAVRVDTSQGFELCPAEACLIDAQCAIDGTVKNMFEIQKDFTHPIIQQHEQFLKKNGVSIAGIEIITTSTGEVLTYDININTNYNPEAEERSGISGTATLAQFFKQTLESATQGEKNVPLRAVTASR